MHALRVMALLSRSDRSGVERPIIFEDLCASLLLLEVVSMLS